MKSDTICVTTSTATRFQLQCLERTRCVAIINHPNRVKAKCFDIGHRSTSDYRTELVDQHFFLTIKCVRHFHLFSFLFLERPLVSYSRCEELERIRGDGDIESRTKNATKQVSSRFYLSHEPNRNRRETIFGVEFFNRDKWIKLNFVGWAGMHRNQSQCKSSTIKCAPNSAMDIIRSTAVDPNNSLERTSSTPENNSNE